MSVRCIFIDRNINISALVTDTQILSSNFDAIEGGVSLNAIAEAETHGRIALQNMDWTLYQTNWVSDYRGNLTDVRAQVYFLLNVLNLLVQLSGQWNRLQIGNTQ